VFKTTQIHQASHKKAHVFHSPHSYPAEPAKPNKPQIKAKSLP